MWRDYQRLTSKLSSAHWPDILNTSCSCFVFSCLLVGLQLAVTSNLYQSLPLFPIFEACYLRQLLVANASNFSSEAFCLSARRLCGEKLMKHRLSVSLHEFATMSHHVTKQSIRVDLSCCFILKQQYPIATTSCRNHFMRRFIDDIFESHLHGHVVVC